MALPTNPATGPSLLLFAVGVRVIVLSRQRRDEAEGADGWEVEYGEGKQDSFLKTKIEHVHEQKYLQVSIPWFLYHLPNRVLCSSKPPLQLGNTALHLIISYSIFNRQYLDALPITDFRVMDFPDSELDGFRLRSYQAEMVDASIQRNIIVAVNHIPNALLWFPSLTLPSDGHWKRKDGNVSA